MQYCIKITRNESNEITARTILFAVDGQCIAPRGIECAWVTGPDDPENLDLKMVSLDENGQMFIETDPDKIEIKTREDEITLRMNRQDFGRRLIAIMSIRNDSKDLTGPEIVQFAQDYADINTALLNGSIATAKALIQSITPDGVITTQADKDALIAEIEANEARLGY